MDGHVRLATETGSTIHTSISKNKYKLQYQNEKKIKKINKKNTKRKIIKNKTPKIISNANKIKYTHINKRVCMRACNCVINICAI